MTSILAGWGLGPPLHHTLRSQVLLLGPQRNEMAFGHLEQWVEQRCECGHAGILGWQVQVGVVGGGENSRMLTSVR